MVCLGHIISSEGIKVDPKKTEAVKNLPSELTPTNIISFLNLDGYYRRFVDGFASIKFFFDYLDPKEC